jgi:protocatechuate 3,4-dioxygenase, beta subunit
MRLSAVGLLLVLAVLLQGAEPKSPALKPGDEVSAWEPVHIAGPHAGTKTCLVCTYLDAPVLLAFARDVTEAAKLAPTLEGIAANHVKGKLKVALVVVDGSDEQLKKLAKDHTIQKLMLCRFDPERKAKHLALYKIDPKALNTILLYQDYTVRKTWANATNADFADIKKATDAYHAKK